MSKINEIENALRQLGGDSFQKLADTYLHRKGYDHINALGAVVGADKVRPGTPDTFIPLSSGKYMFVEYTAQQSDVYRKFHDDLQKCFDEQKTGVPVAKIEEIILCHTSLLTPGDDYRLRQECSDRGIKLTILGVNEIAQDLYRFYPGLARDFLSVAIDTGQILDLDDFIVEHDQNHVTTPLSTTFSFRDDEIARILQALDEDNLVFLSGHAGVGKTRLALECCRKYAEIYPDDDVKCILSHNVNLFDDLQIWFREPKPFLIMVDDANRINRFEYVLQLLHHQSNGRRIKIIATVRDYALSKLVEASRPYSEPSLVELKNLTDDQIRSLVTHQFGMNHHLWLDRIVDIARGNPRLAMMAGRIASVSKTLECIRDVSELYRSYFNTVNHDLELLDDPNLVKVAGIVAFWRAVDRGNEEMMVTIERVFDITQDAFWEAARRLHDMELLDMYENEVVKVSDQVLATYFFYLAAFEKKLISFTAILHHLFPKYRSRIVDALNPVVDAIHSDAIMQQLADSIAAKWKDLIAQGGHYDLLMLMETFGLLQPEQTLAYLQQQVEKLDQEMLKEALIWNKQLYHRSSPSVLGIVAAFRYAPSDIRVMALKILITYLEKKPSELPDALELLTDQFGFEPTSYLQTYKTQQAVIEAVWRGTREGQQPLMTELFLRLAEKFLYTHFTSTKAKGEKSVVFSQFTLHASPELETLRKELWAWVFQLYDNPLYRDSVLKLVTDYAASSHDASAGDIIGTDAASLLPFLSSALDCDNYQHCRIMHAVLKLLRRHGVKYDDGLAVCFSTGVCITAELLFDDLDER